MKFILNVFENYKKKLSQLCYGEAFGSSSFAPFTYFGFQCLLQPLSLQLLPLHLPILVVVQVVKFCGLMMG
jgi:hypothetical protein